MHTARMVMSKWTKVIQYVKKGLEETESMQLRKRSSQHPSVSRSREKVLISQMWGYVVPMVIHVLYLPLDVAVNALAVGAVCELSYHAQSIRPLLSGKKLLDRYNDALTTPLPGNAHNLLPQGHLWWSWSSFFGFTPPSLQRSVRVNRGETRERNEKRMCQLHLSSSCHSLSGSSEIDFILLIETR